MLITFVFNVKCSVNCARYTEQLKELEALNHDLSSDIAASSDREAAHLAYIANLSDQVTKLQLENTELRSQAGIPISVVLDVYY